MGTTVIQGWSLRQLLRYSLRSKEIDDARTFYVERYQRDYAWRAEDEAQDLFDDLTGHFDDDGGTYVLGNVILCPPQEGTVDDPNGLTALRAYEVVDGQQRLTTLLLLLSAVRAESRTLGLTRLADTIGAALTGVQVDHHEDDMGAFFSALLHEEGGGEWDAALMGLPAQRSRSLANAIDVAKHLRLQVQNRASEDQSLLFPLGDKILDETRLAATIADERGGALLSFERANARGRDLGATDLLKNYVFILEDRVASDQDNWDDIDEEWKRLRSLTEETSPKLKFVDVIRWHHETISRSKDRSFRGASLYRNIQAELRNYPGSGTDYLEELAETAEWLVSIHRKGQRRLEDGTPEHILDGLLGLILVRGRSQMKQHLPVLTAARSWDVAEFRELARAMESLMFVAVVCEVRGQAVDSLLRSVVQTMKDAADEPELQLERRKAIVARLTDAAREWAEERGFDEAVRTLQYTSPRDALLIRYVLARVDGAVRASSVNAALHDVEMFSEAQGRTNGTGSRAVRDDLDHVWPQGSADDWEHGDETLHSIGNLVLWTHKTNRAARDTPAVDKLKDHYTRDAENKVRWLLAQETAGAGYGTIRSMGLETPTTWGREEVEMLSRFYVQTLKAVYGW